MELVVSLDGKSVYEGVLKVGMKGLVAHIKGSVSDLFEEFGFKGLDFR